MIWASWWAWIVGGFGLAIVELLVPSFIFLGFSIAAFLIGLLVALGLLGTNFALMVALYAVFALVAWLGLRQFFGKRHSTVKVWDTDINEP
jgi:inner membrane protein